MSEIILPVGSTTTDLQAAVDGAAVGDIIRLSGDMPFVSTVTIAAGQEVTLCSTDGDHWRIEPPSTMVRHISASNVKLTLLDITLDGGGVGGGIELNSGGLLTLGENGTVTNCVANEGGGMLITNGELLIDGGGLTNNRSLTAGGGAFIKGADGLFTLLRGAVNHNSSVSNGGGINASDATVSGGEISHNFTDGGSGGGMRVDNGFTMTGGEIAYNEVRPYDGQPTASGGGVYCGGVLSVEVTISGGSIHNNVVGFTKGGSRGGGLCVYRGVKFLMDGGEVYENSATWGGGLFFDAYMQYGTPEENTVFSGNAHVHNNHASLGGGICFYNNVPGNPGLGILGMAPQIIGNAKITENSAAHGGGILIYPFIGSYERVQIMINATVGGNAEISGNTASERGGGIAIQDDNKGVGIIGTLTVTDNAVVSNNTFTGDGVVGGGISCIRSTLTIGGNAKINQNNAGQKAGGAISIIDCAATISGVTIDGNHANSAAGIYTQLATLNMDGCVVSNNIAGAGDGGGMYVSDNSTVTISGGTIFENNGAPAAGGGGIFTESVDYANLTTGNDTVFRGNTASVACNPPADAPTIYPNIGCATTSVTTHPINNFDINHLGNPLTFNVEYDANGGTGGHVGPDVASGTDDTVLELADTGIVNVGYQLSSWNTRPDGGGDTYLPGDSIRLVANNITLYAQWVKGERYNVIYDCNGGNGGYIDPSREFAVSYTVLSTQRTGITRDGFAFVIWNTQRDGTGLSYLPGQTITIYGNLNLFAQWRLFPSQPHLCRPSVTNTRRAIEGQVLWEDGDNVGGLRPPSSEIQLLRDGEVYRRQTVDAAGDGYFGFCCVPVCQNAAHEYRYNIGWTEVDGYSTRLVGNIVIHTLI